MIETFKYIVLPSNLVALFLSCGLILLVFRHLRRLAFSLLCVSALVYIVFGIGPVSYWLLGRLEYQYPALETFEKVNKVKTIVVLSGYAEVVPGWPLSSEINFASAFRTMEAMRILAAMPDAEIVISGKDDVPEIMKALLISLGLKPKQVRTETRSSNTYESAKNIQQILGSSRFILVTSAAHMPRAMGAFHRVGMKPIPAPTNFMSKKNFLATSYLPSSVHLEFSDLAVHEYLGIIWYRLTNRM